MTQTTAVQKKPWYKKWWVIGVAAVIVIGGFASALTPKEQVTIPDVTGMPAAEAKTSLEDLGFKVTLKNGDTTVISGNDWDAASTDPAGTANKGAKVTISVAEATKRLAGEAARKEAQKQAEKEAREAEQAEREAEYVNTPLEAVEAQSFCDRYAEREFPFGVEMHWIVGKLAEEQTDTGWYMKVEATVTNQFGAEQSGVNVECHMSGTNGTPVMDSFVAY